MSTQSGQAVETGRLVAGINRAAAAMNQAGDVRATWAAIVEQARLLLPAIDQVGACVVHADGRIETVAATDDLMRVLHELQERVGQGPVASAVLSEVPIVAAAARHEQRWPAYIPAALQDGLRAQLAIRLYTDEQSAGVLSFCSTSTDGIGLELEPLVELFVGQATQALGHARRAEQLETALLARSLIGQAIGIVMERFGVDEKRAFDYLVRTSTTSNTKLREIAHRLVGEANRAGGDPARVSEQRGSDRHAPHRQASS